MSENTLFAQCAGDLDPTDPANLAEIVECISTRQETVSRE